MPVRAYERLGGEVMSRALERRRSLTREQRLGSLLSETMARDVRPEDMLDPVEVMREVLTGEEGAVSRSTMRAGDLRGNGQSDILSGATTIRRTENVQVQRNRVPGSRDGDEGSIITEASHIAGEVEGTVLGESRNKAREEASANRIAEWAKSHGIWNGDIESSFDADYGKDKEHKNTDGGESIVWFDNNRGVAIKAIGLDFYGSPKLALERIELHNRYFPETPLRLVGFGEVRDTFDSNGEIEYYARPFNIIVEQSKVDTSRKELSNDEIRRRLELKEFKFLKDRGESGIDMETPDGRAIVSDLHGTNVYDAGGDNVNVIDCDIRSKFASDESLRQNQSPSGMQKSASVQYPDAGAEIKAAPDISFSSASLWRAKRQAKGY